MSMGDDMTQLVVARKTVAYVKEHAIKGNAESVLDAVDEFSKNLEHAMHVGFEKGQILDSVVLNSNPTTTLELGTFFGYSAVRIARLLKPGSKLYCVDFSVEAVELSKELIEFAGLSDRVQVIHGTSTDVLKQFGAGDFPVTSFDFVFIDHLKSLYKSDLILLESLQLIKDKSVILADNILFPGAPAYAEYVRNNIKYQCTTFAIKSGNDSCADEMEKSIYTLK